MTQNTGLSDSENWDRANILCNSHSGSTTTTKKKKWGNRVKKILFYWSDSNIVWSSGLCLFFAASGSFFFFFFLAICTQIVKPFYLHDNSFNAFLPLNKAELSAAELHPSAFDLPSLSVALIPRTEQDKNLLICL